MSLTRRDLLRGMASASLFLQQPMSALAGDQPEMARWSEGYLDIHHISTGRGSCAFAILPDGTTLMIDAGSILSGIEPARDKYLIDPRPNGSLRAGQWIARYVAERLQQARLEQIDYFLLTHFHPDHMGEIAPGNLEISPRSRYGEYQLGGLTDLAEVLPIRRIIDRNYPAYNYPTPHDGPQDRNYQAFGRSFIARGGKVERIRVGRNDQIVLTHRPEAYPTFSVRNLAANGQVWTGVAEETRCYFPALSTLAPADYPSENKCSLAIRLTYGRFDYFSGGDMDHDLRYGRWPWGDIEAVVAKASGPVEVAVTDHHGYVDACGPAWVEALRPRVYVINAWDSAHPTMSAMNNMLSTELYPGERAIFSTAMKPENAIATRQLAQMKSQNGHVVFRVHPGGDRFEVYVIDSSVEYGRVLLKYGPIVCS